MPAITLHPMDRKRLVGALAGNGRFQVILQSAGHLTRCLATVQVEQAEAAVAVRVELLGTTLAVSLPRSAEAPARLAAMIEELANGGRLDDDQGVCEAVDALDTALLDALDAGAGVYALPVEDLDLALLIGFTFARPCFSFRMNGQGLTLPAKIPADRGRARDLLRALALELVANYRSAA